MYFYYKIAWFVYWDWHDLFTGDSMICHLFIGERHGLFTGEWLDMICLFDSSMLFTTITVFPDLFVLPDLHFWPSILSERKMANVIISCSCQCIWYSPSIVKLMLVCLVTCTCGACLSCHYYLWYRFVLSVPCSPPPQETVYLLWQARQ